MTLQELVQLHSLRPQTSVPDWMLGYYKRYSISFANGMTDLQTHVCWLQSRNFTIDLRLPIESHQVAAKLLTQCSDIELQQLANYEGWAASCKWNGSTLSWGDADASLQLHNRWLEPAILKRVGNCMVEFCPSDAYVEDWRLQPSNPGPLIGLQLIEERELATGVIRHKGGGLIVCGDYAALVLGRAQEIETSLPDTTLKTMVEQAKGNPTILAKLFNFETSVAKGSLANGFSVMLSTQASRVGQDLLPLNGFEYPVSYQHSVLGNIQVIRQTLKLQGTACQRLFTIDTLEPQLNFAQATATTKAAADWFERESPTLARYAQILS